MDEDDAVAHAAATAARRPRLDDVAAHVGVSPATVSLVLSNAPGPSAETRRRVLQAAGELGYRPNRTASLLARRRSHLLGVLLEVRNSFHAELVEDLQAASEHLGYELVLSTVTRTRDEQRAVEALLDFRCEALILLGPDAPPARLAALGRQLGRLEGAVVFVVPSTSGANAAYSRQERIEWFARLRALRDELR